MRLDIRGKRWRLEVVDRLSEAAHGEIDPSDRPRKAIRVARTQCPLDLWDTLIHESLHAAFPDMSEEAVNEAGTDIAKALYRLGCRATLPP